MFKLIALDMDGTLLYNHTHISPENTAALNKAVNAGAIIVGATGRPFNALTPDFLKLPGARYVISSNGAVVWDLKEQSCLRKAYLSKEQAIILASNLGDLKEYPVWEEFCVNGKSYAPAHQFEDVHRYTSDDVMAGYFEKTRFPVNDFIEAIATSEDAIERVSCFSEDTDLLLELKKKIIDVPDITITQAQPRDLEVGHTSSSKGQALKYLAEYLEIEPDKVIAFGDGLNDIDMIEFAGCGVAMKNAQDAVKDAADLIADECENDGVAKVLNQFYND